MDQLFVNNYIQNGADSLGAVANIYESWSAFSLDTSGTLSGTLWLEKNGQRVTSGLGKASYQYYDKNGAAVVSLAEVDIDADGNGLFIIDTIANPLINHSEHYVIKVSIYYDGQLRESYRALVREE